LEKRRQQADADAGECLLGLEADATLRDDPHLLHDPRRLGALHVRLVAALGEENAAAALLQAGFLQGLRDAVRGLADGWALHRPTPADTPALAPRVAIALSPPRCGSGERVDLTGTWHDRCEAEGHVAAVGASAEPICFASAGYTSGWLSGLLGEDVLVVETSCAASGRSCCAFRARTAEAWGVARDPGAERALRCLDFTTLRRWIASESAQPADPEAAGAVDPELPVVQVWGPVMVVPFAGPDDSISALDLIGRDDSARDVSVVVVDLGGAIVEEGVAALALEQVLDAIERWGADVVLAGVSPRSVPVVAGLEARHLLVHREIPEAIAAAFQIADAQRRVY
jgi:hypothetical protein